MAQIREEEAGWSSKDYAADNDRDLTIAFQRGDERAFDAIYERYIRLVTFICARALSDAADVQDAIQETFLRVYRRLPQFNGNYHLRSWVAVIASNVCRDSIRASQRTARNVTLGEKELHLLADDTADPQTALLDAAKRRRVRSIVASMSPHYRSALIVRHVEEVSSGELARMLGITEGQARALVHRARRAFKRSWFSSRVTALLSLRWTARWRQLPPDGGTASASSSAVGVGEVVTSSTQATLACTTAVSHCGSAAMERFTAIFAAAVVGVGAPSAAAVATLGTNNVIAHGASQEGASGPEHFGDGVSAEVSVLPPAASTDAGGRASHDDGRAKPVQVEAEVALGESASEEPASPGTEATNSATSEESPPTEPESDATVVIEPSSPSPETTDSAEPESAPAEPDQPEATVTGQGAAGPASTASPPPETATDVATPEPAPVEPPPPVPAATDTAPAETGSSGTPSAETAVTDPLPEIVVVEPPA